MSSNQPAERIQQQIDRIAAVSSDFPGVTIIHDVTTFRVLYMSQWGLDLLQLSLDEVKALTAEEYHQRYFNPDDAQHYLPKALELIQRNSDEPITLFQQVRTAVGGEWVWHMSSMKILMRNDEGLPLLTITTAFPIDPVQHITTKVARLLEENDFLRKHTHIFAKLSARERDILRLHAQGKNSVEIAGELFISATTAETHKRNIRQKLKTSNNYDLLQFARAFDLV